LQAFAVQNQVNTGICRAAFYLYLSENILQTPDFILQMPDFRAHKKSANFFGGGFDRVTASS
jgi:hypothetical protein